MRDNRLMFHERKIYNFFDLLGELGGVMEVIAIGFGVFLYKIANHSFIMKATKRMFKAFTSD